MAEGTATQGTAVPGGGTGAPPRRVTPHGEFIRVLRTRPDWLYGMLCSWGLGLGTLFFLLLVTDPDLTQPLTTVVVPVVLTAVADGSLTNQLGAEPQWVGGHLRSGADPGRILLARNVFLAFWELLFVALVVALTAWLGHDTRWIPRALPQLAVLPLASIAIGNVASVLIPCPFMRLNKRLQAVGTWARWSIYMAVPFGLSSLAAAMWAAPSYLETRWEPHVARFQGATTAYVALWFVVIPLWHLTVWLVSLKFAEGLARVRRHGLVHLMDRHDELVGQLPDLSLREAARQFPARIREVPADLRGELRLIGSEILEATTTLSRV